MKFNIRLSSILIALACCGNTYAGTLTLKPSCQNDDGDCASEFSALLAQAQANKDTIILEPGTYPISEFVYDDQTQPKYYVRIESAPGTRATIVTNKLWFRWVSDVYIERVHIKGDLQHLDQQDSALLAFGMDPKIVSDQYTTTNATLYNSSVTDAAESLISASSINCGYWGSCLNLSYNTLERAGLAKRAYGGRPLGSAIVADNVTGISLANNTILSIAKTGILLGRINTGNVQSNTLHIYNGYSEVGAQPGADIYYPQGGACIYLAGKTGAGGTTDSISNLSVQNNICTGFYGTGIRINGTNINASYNSINSIDGQCRLDDVSGPLNGTGNSGFVGIKTQTGQNITIANNCVRRSTKGIEVAPQSGGLDISGVTIQSNKVYETNYAIEVSKNYGGSYSNVVIDRNVVGGTQYGGIVVATKNDAFGNPLPGLTADRVSITGNTLSNGNTSSPDSSLPYKPLSSSQAMIRIKDQTNTYIDNNWLFGAMTQQRIGHINLEHVNNATLKRNSMTSYGVLSSNGGIKLENSSSYNSVESNNIFIGSGVCVKDDGTNNTVNATCSN